MKESLLAAVLLSFSGVALHSRAGEAPVINFDALTLAVSDVESGGHSDAVGKAGERGLMQIKCGTWAAMTVREFGEAISFDRAFEPELNLAVGRAYLCCLSEQLAVTEGPLRDTHLRLLVASYNRGPQQVADMGYALKALSPEAASYLERVLNLYAIYETEPLEPPLTQWALAEPLAPEADPPVPVAEFEADRNPAAPMRASTQDARMSRDFLQSFSDAISVCLRVIPLSFTGMIFVGVRRSRRLRALEASFLSSLTLPRLRLPSRESFRRVGASFQAGLRHRER